MADLDVGVYVPQIGFTYRDMLHRALRCESLGIGSLWLYDHLYAPGAPEYPSMEAWTLATALLCGTERLRVGHMVLCNQFRHPAVLAKMATTLDHISGQVPVRHRQRVHRGRAPAGGAGVGFVRRTVRAPGRDARDRHPGVRDGPDRRTGQALPRA